MQKFQYRPARIPLAHLGLPSLIPSPPFHIAAAATRFVGFPRP